MRMAVLAMVAGVLAVPTAAWAAFPGASGKLAFTSTRSGFPTESNVFTMGSDGSAQTAITSSSGDELYPAWSPDGARVTFQQGSGLHPEIWSAKADGTDLRQLTTGGAGSRHPAWSPDGTKIVFARDRAPGNTSADLYVMNADGTGVVAITDTAAVDEDYPAWSPDGAKIAFSRDGDIATVAPDGSGLVALTATERIEIEPDWSPNGTQLVFRSGVNSDDEIWRMNANGSAVTNVTNTGSTVEERPVWSPAGDRIAFTKGSFNAAEIWTMNPDGTSQTRLTTNTFLDGQPTWQPVLQGYARPKSTLPRQVYWLVPSYKPCTNPNRTHGPGFEHPSCNPPVQASSYLMPGTADANGHPPAWSSYMQIKTILGDPATTTDEADVKFTTKVKDVLRRSDLGDYNKDVRVEVGVRITDKWNTPYPGGAGPGTGSFTLAWNIPCFRIPDNTSGGRCVLATKADALVPGIVREKSRAVWQLDQIKVFDGGADSVASTTGDNTLLAVQGLFVP